MADKLKRNIYNRIQQQLNCHMNMETARKAKGFIDAAIETVKQYYIDYIEVRTSVWLKKSDVLEAMYQAL